jgi:hypothetical protein
MACDVLNVTSKTRPSPVMPPEVDVASRAGGMSIALTRLRGLAVLMLSDLDRAAAIGLLWSYP